MLAQDAASPAEMVAAVRPDGDLSSWRVISAEGEARWRNIPALSTENSWRIVEAGIALPPGTELLTGNDGQVRLSRAEDDIRIGPDTWLTLEPDATDLVTRIQQKLGQAWYSVRSRISGRFRVDTARIVAVVKGTEFQITIGSDADEMAVREGVVRARATAGGRAIDVRAGQRIRTTASGLVLIAAPGGGSNSGGRTSPDNPANQPAPPNGPGSPPGGGSQPGDGSQPDGGLQGGNNGSRGNGPQDGNNGKSPNSGNNGKGLGNGRDKSRGPRK